MPISSEETLQDYITGRMIPNAGAEANRQMVERILVDVKGYAREAIEVDVPICLDMGQEQYHSRLDLVIKVRGLRYLVIKCAPGSLASREREVIAAARLLETYQVPLAVASDGRTALLWDTLSGKSLGQGWEVVPSREQAEKSFNPESLRPLEEARRIRQKLIFRSYDSMNVHRRTGVSS
ncbi:MAG: hypothetical protein C4519_07735 [Desulfobacteraceae bacterium]|nr:MAG: hypothetical protein C4519_07735 [Desulfobacteraceae bacterium]